MKNNYFTLFFILFTMLGIQKVYSQEYAPIVSHGNISNWKVPIIGLEYVEIDSMHTIETEDGYFELWYEGLGSGYQKEYHGKIRHNEDNSLLYWIAPDAEEEKLIMNLNLEIGEEFEFTDDYGHSFTAKVDAIYEESGLKHVQFNYYLGTLLIGQDPYIPKLTFIEGVGPNCGFYRVLPRFFICKHNNHELFYSLETLYIKNCRIETPWGVNNSNKESEINIYPNPAKDRLHLEIKESMNIHAISLINIQGQIIRRYEPIATQLDISNIAEGFYFIKLSSSEGDVVKKVLIKK